MRPWKLLGLAGLAGVAATGAVLVRNERQRRAYTPEDVRARLHARAAELAASDAPSAVADPAPGHRSRRTRRWRGPRWLSAPAGSRRGRGR